MSCRAHVLPRPCLALRLAPPVSRLAWLVGPFAWPTLPALRPRRVRRWTFREICDLPVGAQALLPRVNVMALLTPHRDPQAGPASNSCSQAISYSLGRSVVRYVALLRAIQPAAHRPPTPA